MGRLVALVAQIIARPWTYQYFDTNPTTPPTIPAQIQKKKTGQFLKLSTPNKFFYFEPKSLNPTKPSIAEYGLEIFHMFSSKQKYKT